MAEQKPQTDPWEQEAAAFKGAPAGTSSTASADNDYSVWNQSGGNGSEHANPGFFGPIQDAFDSLTTVDPTEDREQGKGANAANHFAAGTIQALGEPFVHPIKTLDAVGHAIEHPFDSAKESREAAKAQPFQALGNVAGAGLAMGAAEAPKMAKPIMERFTGYKSPVIAPELQQASKLAKAIRPVDGVGPDLEATLASEMPRINHFAQESGNPMHSVWEGADAARGLAKKGLQHFNDNILGPYANDRISMSAVPEYKGPTLGEGKMTTLGQVNQRLSQINDLIRGAKRTAKSGGMEMTAMERLGLDSEASNLRQILGRELSQRTGLDPEQISQHRQGYGKQFEIADTIDTARRARLKPQGAAAEGSNGVPISKVGLADRFFTTMRGGQDYLANRNFRNAARAFEPAPSNFPEPMARIPKGR